jgi:transcriptional regulator with XRE-family HTH domain
MSTGLQTPATGMEAAGEHAGAVREAGPQEELYQALYGTDNWIAVVKLLRNQVGLTQAEIARGADVSQATVARWLDSEEDAPVRATGRLDDLRYVVLWLIRGCGMPPRLIRFWLGSKNIHLGVDPLSAIAQGRFEQVIEVAHAFAAGRSPAIR